LSVSAATLTGSFVAAEAAAPRQNQLVKQEALTMPTRTHFRKFLRLSKVLLIAIDFLAQDMAMCRPLKSRGELIGPVRTRSSFAPNIAFAVEQRS
jgi:hypothetical protein